jgi:hypothetical protein
VPDPVLHADVQKHDTYAAFVKDVKSESVTAITLLQLRMMTKWRCKWAKKTYRHVAAIDR